MTTDQLLRQLIGEIREVKAILAQLRPHDFTTTLEQEIAMVKAQGKDVGEYLYERGKALSKATRRPPCKKSNS